MNTQQERLKKFSALKAFKINNTATKPETCDDIEVQTNEQFLNMEL